MRSGLEELLDLARSTAVAAGSLLREQRPDDLRVVQTKASEVDVVTQMDKAAERLIVDAVLTARPHDGVLGEEGSNRPGGSGLTWVIDPLDGTTNYLYGLDLHSVSIAVVEGDPDPATWTALAGCVHRSALGVSYWASRGGGAFRDGVPLAGPTDVGLDNALVATGFNPRPGRRQVQAEVAAQLIPQLRDLRRLGSAAIDLCLVGDGRLDGYYERGLSPWDHAAGTLVAREAGTVVSGLGEPQPGIEMLVAGGARLNADLVARLTGLDAARDA